MPSQLNRNSTLDVTLPAATSRNKIVDTVCTSTTVPLLPRGRLILIGRNLRPRLLCFTEPGRPACTAAEEACDARFANASLYECQRFCGKLVLSHVKQRNRQFDPGFYNPQPSTVKSCGGCGLSPFDRRGTNPI